MDSVKRTGVVAGLGGYVVNVVNAYVAFVIAFLTSEAIHLPLHSTYNISNKFLATGYTPEVNFARTIWIAVVGAAVYLGLNWVVHHYPRLFRWLMALLISIGVLGAFLIPATNSFIGNVDTFQHGEQLSPGAAFDHGKHLYTDLFVLHGAGEDVLMPALALHLPHTAWDGGIGSYYFVITTLETLSTFVFILFLARYIRSTAVFLVAAFWFIFSPYSSFYYVRDLFVWTLLILLWYVFHSRFVRWRQAALLGIVGAIASAGIIYSIDRGIIGLFLTFCCMIFLLITDAPAKDGLLKLRLPRKLSHWFAPGYVALGGLVVQGIFLLIIGFRAYKEFLIITFGIIPKYDGLLFNFPLPNASSTSYSLWLPVFLAIIGVLMLVQLIRSEYAAKRFSPHVLLATVLLATSIIYFRTGYGRPDTAHIAYSTPLLFATLFLLASTLWKYGLARDYSVLWMPIVFAIALVFPANNITTTSLSLFPSINPQVGIDYLKLPRRSDSYWLPPNVAAVSDYIKSHTTSNDSIFVFTEQPIYYYLTGRNNPTRFYIPWFADPQPLTNEMLADLKRRPPRIIVYSSGTKWDAPDGYTMSRMAPEVNTWIKAHYPTVVTIGSVTLLEK